MNNKKMGDYGGQVGLVTASAHTNVWRVRGLYHIDQIRQRHSPDYVPPGITVERYRTAMAIHEFAYHMNAEGVAA